MTTPSTTQDETDTATTDEERYQLLAVVVEGLRRLK